MRAALISLPPPGEEALPLIAGKSVAQRQLLFAREMGCTAVIAHGGGASAEAIALRHAAEKAGIRYQLISNSHALPGAIADDDTLLVLQPRILPESRQAMELLRAEGNRMLVISAGPGISGGFERIDLERAWGGALTLPGRWLGVLSSLPEDAAPHAALLRIALQHRLPEARLPDELLDNGSWAVIKDVAAARTIEARWLQSHAGKAPASAISRRLAQQIITNTGAWLLERRVSRPLLFALWLGLLGGGLAAALFERPTLAFALVSLSAPVFETFVTLSRLVMAPFGTVARWPLLRWSSDAALIAIGFIAIDSLWYRAAFPPFVLVAALALSDRSAVPTLVEPLRDRGLLTALIALLTVFISTEAAVMIAASTLLAALFLSPSATRLTRN